MQDEKETMRVGAALLAECANHLTDLPQSNPMSRQGLGTAVVAQVTLSRK